MKSLSWASSMQRTSSSIEEAIETAKKGMMTRHLGIIARKCFATYSRSALLFQLTLGVPSCLGGHSCFFLFCNHLRSQILSLNGLDENQLNEKQAQQTLMDLLEESEAEYKHQRVEKLHPTNKLLNRWFYKQPTQTEDKSINSEARSFKQDAGMDNNELKNMIEDYGTTPSTSSDGTIQVDVKKAFNKNVSLLKTAKSKLVKLLDEGLEIADTLLTMDKNVYGSIHGNIKDKMQTLRDFMDNTLRVGIAKFNLLDTSSVDLQGPLKESGDLLAEANSHFSLVTAFLIQWKALAGL